jgi:hypothetical protein
MFVRAAQIAAEGVRSAFGFFLWALIVLVLRDHDSWGLGE